jgi:hypothetical protein
MVDDPRTAVQPTVRQSSPNTRAPKSDVRNSGVFFYGALTLAVAFLFAIFIQYHTGAWRDDFSATGDEASHFTSAVAMRGYLSSHEILRPYDFASQFYLHYPKVAFGKWPPVFYVASGIWFLLVPPSRFSAMLFIALQTSLLALAVFWVASRLQTRLIAFLSAILVVATPFFAMHATIFMLEPQVAAIALLSLLAFLAFFRRPGWITGACAVLATTAAILTKANGWALLVSAGLSYLWLRRDLSISLVKTAIVFAAILVLSVPFYYVFVNAMADGNEASSPTLAFTLHAIPAYLDGTLESVGIAVCLLFVFRLILCLRGKYAVGEDRQLIAVLFAWIAGPFLFQSIVPASFEIRHLAIAFPPVCLVAVSLTGLLAERFGPRFVPTAAIGLILLTIPWTMPARYSELFQITAARIVPKLSASPNGAILITSNGPGEGRLVASMVALDPAARDFCVRPTKLIVDSNWGATDYHLLATTKEEVLAKLDSVPVSYVAVHNMELRRSRMAHHALISEALVSAPERWRLDQVIESTSLPDGKETVAIYENTANLARPVTDLNIDMHRKLNRVLVLRPPE